MRSHPLSSAQLIRLRSPFRYPGGKTWLVPYILHWFTTLPQKPVEFIEPFAGGGIIGLTVAFEQLAKHITLVEIDEEVAAVWQTILNGEGEWLANQIAFFDLTLDSLNAELSKKNLTLKEVAFQTILKNRVNRGGILASGAGRLKYGDGKGLTSRWYPNTLQKRILEIIDIQDRITFIKGNGLDVLRQNTQRPDVVFFIDPPYTVTGKKAGSRLYTHSEIDHQELFSLTSRLAGNFLMTYSDDEPVRELARQYGFETKTVGMKNTHHAEMTELLISRKLVWPTDF